MRSGKILKDFFKANAWRYALGLVWLMVVNIFNLQIPRLLGEVTDLIQSRQIDSAGLLRYGGYIIGIAVVMALGRYFWRIYIMGSSRRLAYYLRNRLFAHLETLSVNFFNTHKTGDLMAHATNDINAIRMAMGPVCSCLRTPPFNCGNSVYNGYQDRLKLTVLALLPLPF